MFVCRREVKLGKKRMISRDSKNGWGGGTRAVRGWPGQKYQVRGVR